MSASAWPRYLTGFGVGLSVSTLVAVITGRFIRGRRDP